MSADLHKQMQHYPGHQPLFNASMAAANAAAFSNAFAFHQPGYGAPGHLQYYARTAWQQ